jgi:hypothetical protein
VTRSEGGWCASCEGRDAEDGQLIVAIRDALGLDRGEGLMLGVGAAASAEQWIRETAAHIVGDTLH